MTAARSQAPPDLLSLLSLAQTPGRSQNKTSGQPANSHNSPRSSFGEVLGGVTKEKEEAEPPALRPDSRNGAGAAAQTTAGQPDDWLQAQLAAMVRIAPDGELGPPQDPASLNAAPEPTPEFPVQPAAAGPRMRTTQPGAGQTAEPPSAGLPSIAAAPVQVLVPPVQVSPVALAPLPQIPVEQTNPDTPIDEPTGTSVGATVQDTPPLASVPTPNNGPAMAPGRSTPASAPAGAVSTPQPSLRPVDPSSSFASQQPETTSPSPSGGQTGSVTRNAEGPRVEPALPKHPVEAEAPPEERVPRVNVIAPQREANGETPPSSGQIVTPTARYPLPAKVFAKSGSSDRPAAMVVSWVATHSTALPEPPVNQPVTPQNATPVAGEPVNCSAEPQAATQPSAVPNGAAPELAKATTRGTWAQEVPSDGRFADTWTSAGTALQAQPVPIAQTPPPSAPPAVVAANEATPCLMDSAASPAVANTPAGSRIRTESARAVPRSPQGAGIVAANLPAGVSGKSETQAPAGRIAFEALLTPEAQEPSCGADTPIQADTTPGNQVPQARIVPAGGIAPHGVTPEEASPAPVDAVPAVESPAPATAQKQSQASNSESAGAPGRSDAGRKQTAAPVTASPAMAPDAAAATPVRSAATRDAASGSNRPDSPSPRAAQTAEGAADVHPATDQPKPPLAARDLRFAVGGGDQRVEVRLAERGGEVHVAVRTPDDRLAGSLRDDLPSLTARLESAGLRTETWHGGSSSSTGRERLMESSSQAMSQNSQEQPGKNGRRQQEDPPPQRPRRSDEDSHPKPDRKDFQWLFTSLR